MDLMGCGLRSNVSLIQYRKHFSGALSDASPLYRK